MPEAAAAALIAALAAREQPPEPEPALAALIEHLRSRYGEALLGIWLYGSWLRGKRDTLVDFYLVIDDSQPRPEPRWQPWLERLLPPNVYYLPAPERGGPDMQTHAKYAVITLPVLQHALERGFHPYFWARLAQPCWLVAARDNNARQSLTQLRALAVQRCLSEARTLVSHDASAEDLWSTLFTQTYRTELRSEPPGRANAIVTAELDYFEAITSAATAGPTPPAIPTKMSPRAATRLWQRRALVGKALSILRLMKAALTFNQGLAYLLWKVERHSGVRLSASPLQHRYPLLFAWPLVYRAWRAGGFR
ncbi:MAG: hypothetical protein AAGI15_13945 [Pseudomonadota bacterium]